MSSPPVACLPWSPGNCPFLPHPHSAPGQSMLASRWITRLSPHTPGPHTGNSPDTPGYVTPHHSCYHHPILSAGLVHAPGTAPHPHLARGLHHPTPAYTCHVSGNTTMDTPLHSPSTPRPCCPRLSPGPRVSFPLDHLPPHRFLRGPRHTPVLCWYYPLVSFLYSLSPPRPLPPPGSRSHTWFSQSPHTLH